MAAHEALGRQFLERHMADHHALSDREINDPMQEGDALNASHADLHAYAGTDYHTRDEVAHTHSPEEIKFGSWRG